MFMQDIVNIYVKFAQGLHKDATKSALTFLHVYVKVCLMFTQGLLNVCIQFAQSLHQYAREFRRGTYQCWHCLRWHRKIRRPEKFQNDPQNLAKSAVLVRCRKWHVRCVACLRIWATLPECICTFHQCIAPPMEIVLFIINHSSKLDFLRNMEIARVEKTINGKLKN